jgi:hypothetical protein
MLKIRIVILLNRSDIKNKLFILRKTLFIKHISRGCRFFLFLDIVHIKLIRLKIYLRLEGRWWVSNRLNSLHRHEISSGVISTLIFLLYHRPLKLVLLRLVEQLIYNCRWFSFLVHILLLLFTWALIFISLFYHLQTIFYLYFAWVYLQISLFFTFLLINLQL